MEILWSRIIGLTFILTKNWLQIQNNGAPFFGSGEGIAGEGIAGEGIAGEGIAYSFKI